MEDEDNEEDCAFCMGREATERGEPADSNPFVPSQATRGSDEYYESDYVLWDFGFSTR